MTLDVYRLYRNFFFFFWKLSSYSKIYKLLRLLCKHSELNSFTLCLQRKNNLKDVGVNFNLYHLWPTSILVYICILLEMLVLPVIQYFVLLLLLSIHCCLFFSRSTQKKNTSLRKLQLKSFIKTIVLFSFRFILWIHAVTPQNVILTQNVIRIAAKCILPQNVITLTQNVIKFSTQNVIIFQRKL